MKKYKLKRWYPSLDSCWEVGDIALYYRNGVYWNSTRVVENGVSAKEVENNPDFWELIEEEKPKPLFITEDGVEVYVDDFVVFVNSKLEKSTWRASIINNGWDFSKVKAFSCKSNADEYIAWHKKGFSVNDLLLADIGITTNQLDKLHQMAIKKI